jgi:hypothetical protein
MIYLILCISVKKRFARLKKKIKKKRKMIKNIKKIKMRSLTLDVSIGKKGINFKDIKWMVSDGLQMK